MFLGCKSTERYLTTVSCGHWDTGGKGKWIKKIRRYWVFSVATLFKIKIKQPHLLRLWTDKQGLMV